MVMMQSPSSLSDSGRPESPVSNPDSPSNNNNSNTPNKEIKFSEDAKDIKQKFSSVLSAINKESRNNNLDQILYPKSNERDLNEPSAKFSIERLKQLADQRLSPSNIENSGLNNNLKFQANGSPLVVTSLPINMEISHPIFSTHHQPPPPHHLHILSHNSHLKYAGLLPTVMSSIPNNNNNINTSELDIERIKLARTLSNGKELSDFGFRIQLGGLSAHFSENSELQSDSEELNVDGNEESSQDENSVS